MYWQTSRFRIDLSRPVVMGIVNVTPDSFSDGGKWGTAETACQHCDTLLAQGADILDIGAESTRPGATAPTVSEELARLAPVVQHATTLGIPISVDTSRAEVMRACLAWGADIINDVRALRLPGALQAVSEHPLAGICLMHWPTKPADASGLPVHRDIVSQAATFLDERIQALLREGVSSDRIVLDPGYGFDKSLAENLQLAQQQALLSALGFPVLAGWSRKGTLGKLTGRVVGDRLAASLAAALASVHAGARIVRVHDVAPTVDALKVWRALSPEGPMSGATMRQEGEDG